LKLIDAKLKGNFEDTRSMKFLGRGVPRVQHNIDKSIDIIKQESVIFILLNPRYLINTLDRSTIFGYWQEKT
jgi:hypothetical protein